MKVTFIFVCKYVSKYIIIFFNLEACWRCRDDNECAKSPVVRNGNLVAKYDVYSEVGCDLGCWVSESTISIKHHPS